MLDVLPRLCTLLRLLLPDISLSPSVGNDISSRRKSSSLSYSSYGVIVDPDGVGLEPPPEYEEDVLQDGCGISPLDDVE